jgi:ketol-acid reductoisomerase
VKVYYDADADLNLIVNKKIAILAMVRRADAHARTCATAA